MSLWTALLTSLHGLAVGLIIGRHVEWHRLGRAQGERDAASDSRNKLDAAALGAYGRGDDLPAGDEYVIGVAVVLQETGVHLKRATAAVEQARACEGVDAGGHAEGGVVVDVGERPLPLEVEIGCSAVVVDGLVLYQAVSVLAADVLPLGASELVPIDVPLDLHRVRDGNTHGEGCARHGQEGQHNHDGRLHLIFLSFS